MGPLGTGFIVTTQGHVVTAKHVADALEASKPRDAAGNLLPVSHQFLGVGLPGPNTPNARANFLLVPAELVDVDALHDVALLKITVGGTLVPTKLSPSRPEEGQPIAVSGYPLSNVVLVTTSGAVASSWSYGLDPTSTGLTISDWYTSDMRVNPGNSGGPVYSVATGAVIGVCVLSEQAPVQYSDGAKEPVKIEGRFLAYNSGLSIFVPIKYAIELLRKKNIKWSEAGAH
jgi:S1-C subfamily serine protease